MGMNGDGAVRSEGKERRAAASDRGAPGRSAWLRAGLTPRLGALGTPPLRITLRVIRSGGSGEAPLRILGIGCTSHGASNFSRRDGSIRKIIIGHRMRYGAWHRTGHGAGHGTRRGMDVRRKQSLARSVFRDARRTLALLDQPAREHGAGVLFHPLIEQRANLLAEIGGVGKARELVALERVARSREKKLPRRLGWGTGHVSLLRRTCAK